MLRDQAPVFHQCLSVYQYFWAFQDLKVLSGATLVVGLEDLSQPQVHFGFHLPVTIRHYHWSPKCLGFLHSVLESRDFLFRFEFGPLVLFALKKFHNDKAQLAGVVARLTQV